MKSQLRREFDALKSTKAFTVFKYDLLDRLDGCCAYCSEPVYVDRVVPYCYPAWWWDKDGPCFGLPRTFIDRTWAYHIDHIKPLSRGGTNDFANLTIACPGCNGRKGVKDATPSCR